MQNQDSTFHLVTFPTLLTIGFSIPKAHMITVSMNASLLEKLSVLSCYVKQSLVRVRKIKQHMITDILTINFPKEHQKKTC